MAKITYLDKDQNASEGTPQKAWRDSDANEVKASVNALHDTVDNVALGANYRIVEDVDARNGIANEDRKDGLLVYMTSLRRTDQLRGGTANTDWIEDVFSGGGGGDVTAPTVSSATVEDSDPDALVVVFSESVNITNLTGLSLSFSTGTAKTLSSVSGSGSNTLTFALSAAIENGDVFTFDFGASNTIEDTSGNALAAGNSSVTNNVAADPAPTLSSATVEDASPYDVVLTFSEVVTATNTGYTVRFDGVPITISSLSGSGTDTLTLTVDQPCRENYTVTLDYSAGDTQDGASQSLADISGQAVTNNVAESVDPAGVPSVANVFLLDQGVTESAGSISQIDAVTGTDSFTQATASKQPQYISNVLNGYAVARFDGVDDEILTTAASTDLSAYTLIEVARFNTTAVSNQVISALYHDAAARSLLYRNTGEPYKANYNSSGYIDRTLAYDSDWHIFTRKYDGTEVHFYMDGLLIGSLAATDPTTVSLEKVIGSRKGSLYGDIDYAARADFSTALSDTDRHGVERYFADRFDLPLERYELLNAYEIVELTDGGFPIANTGIDYDPTNDRLIIGQWGDNDINKLLFYNRADFSLDTTIDITGAVDNIQGIAYDDVNQRVYVLGYDGGTTTEYIKGFNMAGTVIFSAAFSTAAYGGLSSSMTWYNGYLYYKNRGVQEIYEFDVSGGSLTLNSTIATATTSANTEGLWLNASTFMVNHEPPSGNEVALYDRSSNELIQKFVTGDEWAEGCYLVGDYIYVNNDAGLHGDPGQLNELFIYKKVKS